MKDSNKGITTFLTFPGNAEEAINFYVSVFPNSEILELSRYEEGMPGPVGKVINGYFKLKGQEFMAMDMDETEAPEFNWAISLFVNCTEEPEFDDLFSRLSADGVVLMGPEPVMHIRKVAWVTDRFGVTWQLIFE